MKIYIASHSSDSANRAARYIESNLSPQVQIISTWHRKEADGLQATASLSIADREAIAIRDVDEVQQCDVLILIAGPDKYSGGKFVEAGIAFGLCKRVIVVGRRENMLLWHPDIVSFEVSFRLIPYLQILAGGKWPPQIDASEEMLPDVADEDYEAQLRRTRTTNSCPSWASIRENWKGGPA